LVVLLLCAEPQAVEWAPPEDPRPSQILREAQDDALAGRYEVALEKHLWFHRNALRYEQGLRGVRLSFALGYWARLADEYPPARAALEGVRDEAWAGVMPALSPTTAFESFQEFAAINRTLRDDGRTVAAFEQLDEERPDLAERLISVAQPALVRQKQYSVCARYVSLDAASRATEMYRHTKEAAAAGRIPSSTVQFAEKKFENDMSILVALLVVSGRDAEARRVAAEAEQERSNEAFKATLEAALKGTVPQPWP
jgi:hypothetical protein